MFIIITQIMMNGNLHKLLAAAILGSLLVYRSLILGFPALFDPFDTLIFLTLTFLLSSLLLKEEKGITEVIASLFLLMTLFLPKNLTGIPPILRTPLFFIHVGTAMVAYGMVIYGGAVGVEGITKKRNFSGIENIIKTAFLLFSISMVIGGIWAFLAWGDITPVEPKSIFSLGLWLYLSFSVHLFKNKNLKKLSNVFLVMGAILVIFNFLIVNFLFGGTHAF